MPEQEQNVGISDIAIVTIRFVRDIKFVNVISQKFYETGSWTYKKVTYL